MPPVNNVAGARVRRGPGAAVILRWLAALLAAVFLADPIVGVSAWIQVRKAAVKHEVRRHIVSRADRAGLVLLEFSAAETGSLLRWEHSREFEFDGQMYDIVESWTDGDRVFYRCYWDRAETRLNRALRELAVRAFGAAASKFGSDEGLGSRLLESRDCVLARAWRPPASRLPGLPLRMSEPGCPSRSLQPPTPPPRFA